MNTASKEHRFGPNETIRGVIRKMNNDAMTPKMLTFLMKQYNTLNENKIPRPGDLVQIPIFVGFIGNN